MRHECFALSARNGSHRRRLRLMLVFVEDVQVAVLHVAQSNVTSHALILTEVVGWQPMARYDVLRELLINRIVCDVPGAQQHVHTIFVDITAMWRSLTQSLQRVRGSRGPRRQPRATSWLAARVL